MSHSNLLELSTFPFHHFFQFLQFCFYVDKAISRYFLEELKRVKKTKIVKTAKLFLFGLVKIIQIIHSCSSSFSLLLWFF